MTPRSCGPSSLWFASSTTPPARLHAGIGYVTPDDEHQGRGPEIRRARRAGLHRAHRHRIAYHRQERNESQPPQTR
jgi:hypothetical protein